MLLVLFDLASRSRLLLAVCSDVWVKPRERASWSIPRLLTSTKRQIKRLKRFQTAGKHSLIHPGDFKQACRVLWVISREAEQLIGEVLVEITDMTCDTRPAFLFFSNKSLDWFVSLTMHRRLRGNV